MPRRPEPPYLPPRGQVWVPVAEDPHDWRPQPGRPCRYTVAKWVICRADSVAAANRRKTVYDAGRARHVDSWWAYCGEHLAAYSRWLDGGMVWRWDLAHGDTDFIHPALEVR